MMMNILKLKCIISLLTMSAFITNWQPIEGGGRKKNDITIKTNLA